MNTQGFLITPALLKRWAKYFVVTVLLLIPSILFIVSQREIKSLKKEVESLKHDQQELETTFNDYKEVVSAFYQEYQDTGLLTVDVLKETITRMEDAITVYDDNVDIYNNQIQDLYARTDRLEESVKIIAEYLAR